MKTFWRPTFMAVLILFSGACARPVFDGPPKVPQIAPPVVLHHMPSETQEPIALSLPSGEYQTGDLFSLISMTGARARSPLENPRALVEAFYAGKGTLSSARFSQTPYATFLIENSRNPFLMNTYNLDEQREGQLLNVRLLLQRRSWYLKQTTADMEAPELFAIADRYINETRQDISIGRLEDKIRDSIIAGMDQLQSKTLKPATVRLVTLEESNNLRETLAIIQDLIGTLNINLEVETEEQFAIARRLQDLIEAATSPKAALALLVELWDQLPSDQRETIFLKASPDFYKFMKSSTPEERNCLKVGSCGFGATIAKHLFILPAIEQFGVERLRSEIHSEVLKTMKQGVRRMLRESLTDLPSRLNAEIRDQVAREYLRIAGYTEDYPQFVRKELDRWFTTHFNTTLAPGFEVQRVRVTAEPRRLRIEGIADERGRMVIGAESLGQVLEATASIESFPKIFRTLDEGRQRLLWGITRFNQVVGFESWLVTQQHLSFFPQQSSLVQGLTLSRRSHPASFDIGGQASLLKGFVATARYAQDWEPHPHRQAVDQTLLKDLLPNLPSASLGVPAFSGDVLLAKSIYNSSLILQQLKARGTPLFQLCPKQGITYFDSGTSCAQPSSLAGLVDVIEGERQSVTRTESLARFLIGLLDFLEFSERDLPKTKSPYLQQTMVPNRPPALAELQNALPELRQLAIGLTHLLGSQLQNPEGQFKMGYSMIEQRALEGETTLKTQLAGLEALSRAANFFKVPAYRRSAANAYSSLNRNYWDPQRSFYRGNHPTPTWIEGRDVLRAMQAFRQLLDLPEEQAPVELLIRRLTPDK